MFLRKFGFSFLFGKYVCVACVSIRYHKQYLVTYDVLTLSNCCYKDKFYAYFVFSRREKKPMAATNGRACMNRKYFELVRKFQNQKKSKSIWLEIVVLKIACTIEFSRRSEHTKPPFTLTRWHAIEPKKPVYVVEYSFDIILSGKSRTLGCCRYCFYVQ